MAIESHNEIPYDLIAKVLSGEGSVSEMEEVDRWKKASAENEAEYQRLTSVWKEPYEVVEEFDASHAWSNVSKRLHSDQKERPVRSLNASRTWWAVAASVAILIGVFATYQNFFSGSEMVKLVANQTESITLPDGSSIMLQAGSTLEYEKSFKSRTLELKGKGYFDVTRDETRPFEVHTANGTTRVLGTRFFVDAQNQDSTVVTVKEGKVMVYLQKAEVTADSTAVIVTPGKSAVAIKKSGMVKSATTNDPSYEYWKSKSLVFKNTSMKKVIEILEDLFKVNIETSSRSLLKCKLTASFQDEKLEVMLQVISDTFGWKLTQDSNRYVLEGTSCEP